MLFPFHFWAYRCYDFGARNDTVVLKIVVMTIFRLPLCRVAVIIRNSGAALLSVQNQSTAFFFILNGKNSSLKWPFHVASNRHDYRGNAILVVNCLHNFHL